MPRSEVAGRSRWGYLGGGDSGPASGAAAETCQAKDNDQAPLPATGAGGEEAALALAGPLIGPRGQGASGWGPVGGKQAPVARGQGASLRQAGALGT